MTYRRIALFAASLVLSTQLVRAQEAPLAPRGLDALAARATLHSDMTFDESMLHAASAIVPDEDKPIIAKLRSIAVHNFKFSAAGYDPAALDAVRAQYSGHGWNHLVAKQTHPPAEPAASTAAATPTTAPWLDHRSRSIQRGPMSGCGWSMGISTEWSCWWRIHEPSMSS